MAAPFSLTWFLPALVAIGRRQRWHRALASWACLPCRRAVSPPCVAAPRPLCSSVLWTFPSIAAAPSHWRPFVMRYGTRSRDVCTKHQSAIKKCHVKNLPTRRGRKHYKTCAKHSNETTIALMFFVIYNILVYSNSVYYKTPRKQLDRLLWLFCVFARSEKRMYLNFFSYS